MKQTVRSVSLEDAHWLNREPLSKRDLLGKIVLLDFFTYCCMNCLNILADLKSLEEEFAEELLVIGVHSGKHPHEKEDGSILEAMQRYKIKHCVINDAEHRYWDAYGIKAWPTLVLIDPKGYVVKQYQGEGHLNALSTDIQALIKEHTPSKKRFEVQQAKYSSSLLHYPQKIVASEKYLFISQLDEVLVCSYEGEILHTIKDVMQPQGMAFVNDKLYISSPVQNCVFEVKDNFFSCSIWRDDLRNPYDLVSDGKVLYVALAGAHQIKGYALDSKEECFCIGQENSESLHDGKYDEAVLAQPTGLSLLDKELWFVDSESSSLRCAAYGKVRSHIYDNDELQHPLDITVGIYGDGCGGGRIFIVDSYNNEIKVYDPESKQLMTLLENLDEPSGIAKKGCSLYICNTNAHEIIVFDLSKMQSTTLNVKEH